MALLALTSIGLWVHGWWGTITLNYENQAMEKVLLSFTRQSSLPVVTDLDPKKPITIHINRVAVAEALDALQAVTESSGRLVYLAAPNPTELKNALTLQPRKLDPEIWKTIEYRLPYMFLSGSENLPRWGDPRQQMWKPASSPGASLISHLENVAQCTDLRIVLSAHWNPKVEKPLSPGPISSVLPSLMQQAGGRGKMVFWLSGPLQEKESSSGTADRPSTENWRRGWPEGSPLPPEAFSARLQARISHLATDQAKEAQASIDESTKQYREWLALSPEEQEKKLQEIMQDPNRQARGSERFTRGMRMMSPQQRAQRYSRYNARKEAIKDPGHNR